MQEAPAVNGHRPRIHNGSHARASRSKTACPVCATSAHSEKVSNVVRCGRGKLIFGNGEIARYETELAELLDEPPRPRETSILRAAMEALPPLAVLAGVLLTIALLQSQDYVVIPQKAAEVARNIGLVWFGLLIPGVLILRYAQTRVDVEREMPSWILARRRWSSLYYCSRDDVVFSPILNAVATPQEIREMLYADTDPSRDIQQDVAASATLREVK